MRGSEKPVVYATPGNGVSERERDSGRDGKRDTASDTGRSDLVGEGEEEAPAGASAPAGERGSSSLSYTVKSRHSSLLPGTY